MAVDMAILSFLFGIILGSFLNVVAYRLPRKESLILPQSRCTSCSAHIKYYDNIPVVSWLLLRGRCRSCKSKISLRYLIVELGTGFLFILIVEKFESRSPILLAAVLFLAAITITLAVIDLDTHTLPNRILLPGFIIGSLTLGIEGIVNHHYSALVRAVMGALALGLFYLILSLIYPGGMGMGDVKFAGLLGLFLGYLSWGVLLVATFSAFFLGGIFAIALVLTRNANRKGGIPFGPWMSIGTWVGILFGASILYRYYSIFGLVNRA